MITVKFLGEGDFAYQTSNSSGADLCAQKDTTIPPGEAAVIPTGVFIQSFERELIGYAGEQQDTVAFDLQPELQVRGRSSLAMVGILCPTGTVDPDYRGEVRVTLLNLSESPFDIKLGDRIGQLVGCLTFTIGGVPVKDVDRNGGHGSTGK